mmetsp:Transcript_71238/g.183643  ORF Transcript_71238/g.183643 Transcript_71238/m.183643 type:complete len:173 (-) Transcript_71238:104-622(-)
MDWEGRLQQAAQRCDVQAVLEEMSREPDEEVQRAACDTLFRLVQHSHEAANDFVSGSGATAVVSAMKSYSSDPDLLCEGSSLLWRVIHMGGSAAAKAVVDEGGFNALDSTLRAQPEGTAAHEAAMLAMSILADHGWVRFGDEKEGLGIAGSHNKGRAYAQVIVYPEARFDQR